MCLSIRRMFLIKNSVITLSGLIILLFQPTAEAKKIFSDTIISKDTVYQNASIDLNSGSFQIINNATLKIENSTINGTISADNTAFFKVTNGKLILKNSMFNINSVRLPAVPDLPAIYYSINVLQGSVDIDNNKFFTNKDYTVGFLTTNRLATTGFKITNNEFHRLHGGILLRNATHAVIENNKFDHVSSSNIFLIDSSDHLIKRNTILFSGNNNVGDGLDITDSANITITQNYIASGSCYSMMVLHGKNINITDNKILSGITYAISIAGSIGEKTASDQYLLKLIGNRATRVAGNENITITHNYLSQNRFGITTDNTDRLIVKNNLFIQRFADNNARKFWTNNDILIKNTVNVSWEDNLYKEAYSQDPQGDNSLSGKTVSFPLHGGVIL